MESIHHQSHAGCSIKPPQGWIVQAFPSSIVMVLSPDGEAFSLVEFITGPASQKSVSEILGKGLFHSTSFFPKAKPPQLAVPESGDSATGFIRYFTPKGAPGRARLTCLKKNSNVVVLAYAAPENLFAQVEPLLQQTLELFEPSAAPSPHPASPLPRQPQHQPVPEQQQPQLQMPSFDEPKANPWRSKTADKAFSNMDAYIREDSPKTEASARVPPQPLQSPVSLQHQSAPSQHETAPPLQEPIPPRQEPASGPHVSSTVPSFLQGLADFFPKQQASPVQHQPVQHQPVAPHAAPGSYTKFTEPEKGTFTVEVPHGWQVKGGFNHPMPGDRRPWIEAVSPEGIYIACDPSFPQNFCHFRDQLEGHPAAMAAGGQLLNLKPSAQRVGDFYVENFASRHFGSLQRQLRRPRPDMVDLLKSQYQKNGVPIGGKWEITSDEMVFNLNQGGQPFVLSVLSTAAFNGEYSMWIWAFWDANVYVYIAPPQFAAQAEQVRAHMKASIHFTPKIMQIYQQDEARISAAGHQAHIVQQNWFTQQQSIHNTQTAFGDSIVANYWRHR